MEPNKYRLIYEGITPEQACLLPDHGQVCYELASDIMAKTGRQIFIGTDPEAAHHHNGPRLKTACLLLKPKEARIAKVKESIQNRVIFHELSHLQQRWIERLPIVEVPAYSPQRWAVQLSNEIDHLEFVRREIGFFGGEAEKLWARRWSQIPKAKGAILKSSVYLSLAMKWMVVREVLNPKYHAKIRYQLHRFGMFKKADKFVDEIVDLKTDRRAMVRFALREFEYSGTDVRFRTFDPVLGTEVTEAVF